MPNWCDNTLRVYGPERELVKFLVEARGECSEGDEPSPISFNSLRPIPEGEKNNWYDWCIQHWGTKWDVTEPTVSRISRGVRFRFDTAWAPPVELIRYVADKYPKLRFVLSYNEPGMGFRGRVEFRRGKMVADKHCGSSFGMFGTTPCRTKKAGRARAKET